MTTKTKIWTRLISAAMNRKTLKPLIPSERYGVSSAAKARLFFPDTLGVAIVHDE